VTLLGHSDGVRSVGFSNDGKFLASGSSDKTIKIWWLQSFIGAEQIEKEHFIENTEKALFPYKPCNYLYIYIYFVHY
jgi:WD40 repeat protein